MKQEKKKKDISLVYISDFHLRYQFFCGVPFFHCSIIDVCVVCVSGLPFNEVYCASKFAVEGVCESLAILLQHFNIQCVFISVTDKDVLLKSKPTATTTKKSTDVTQKSFI